MEQRLLKRKNSAVPLYKVSNLEVTPSQNYKSPKDAAVVIHCQCYITKLDKLYNVFLNVLLIYTPM